MEVQVRSTTQCAKCANEKRLIILNNYINFEAKVS
jgi:hypothetical protein